jgi:hypothetical protein
MPLGASTGARNPVVDAVRAAAAGAVPRGTGAGGGGGEGAGAATKANIVGDVQQWTHHEECQQECMRSKRSQDRHHTRTPLRFERAGNQVKHAILA